MNIKNPAANRMLLPVKQRQTCKPGSVTHLGGFPVIYPETDSHLFSNDLPSGIGQATLKPRYIWSFNT
jgi:hypothetical protein